jgi:carbon storage regulator
MLVLRRRTGESVLIGDQIEIELLAVTQQGAKIGIRAPKETVVLRKELKITQDQNNQAAIGPSVKDLEQATKKLRPSIQESVLLPDKQFEH